MLRDKIYLLVLPLCCVVFLYSRYRKLSSLPGPWLASFTDLWRGYAQKHRNITTVLLQLHKQYGPVLRIGPNTVSVSDAHAVSSIYTMHGDFIKVSSTIPNLCCIGYNEQDRPTPTTLSAHSLTAPSAAA